MILGVAVLIPVIVNAVLITKSGQSLGKKAVGTRMVDQQTGAQVGFVQGYLVRSFAFGFLTGLPVVALSSRLPTSFFSSPRTTRRYTTGSPKHSSSKRRCNTGVASNRMLSVVGIAALVTSSKILSQRRAIHVRQGGPNDGP